MTKILLTLTLAAILLTACAAPSGTGSPVAAGEASSTPEPAAPGSRSAPEPGGYITFVINVHDWVHADESADTLLRLVDIFETYGVRGDFYFTAPVVEAYVNERPDVIERLKNSDMTISYHVRPPHPLYTGFDGRLEGLDDAALYQTLLDYETYALDLTNGDLDRSRPGGYAYVASVFGRNPVAAPAPTDNPRIKQVAERVYASLGAQMTLHYHEFGTDPYEPFVWSNELLVRPSDFSVTRTTAVDGRDDFWWNHRTGPDAAIYNPTAMLQSGLDDWESHAYGRPPIITSLIHENNFPRSGAEAWSAYYFVMERGRKTDPLLPPYDLSAPDPSSLRRDGEQAAIWAAYEEMVAWAAANLQVVTSEDLVLLAQGQ
jgi:hypothetical protein